jgi:hypothetical protein
MGKERFGIPEMEKNVISEVQRQAKHSYYGGHLLVQSQGMLGGATHGNDEHGHASEDEL